VPANPLSAAAVTVTACAGPPALRLTLAGLEESEKSAIGFVWEPLLLLPPPQPLTMQTTARMQMRLEPDVKNLLTICLAVSIGRNKLLEGWEQRENRPAVTVETGVSRDVAVSQNRS